MSFGCCKKKEEPVVEQQQYQEYDPALDLWKTILEQKGAWWDGSLKNSLSRSTSPIRSQISANETVKESQKIFINIRNVTPLVELEEQPQELAVQEAVQDLDQVE